MGGDVGVQRPVQAHEDATSKAWSRRSRGRNQDMRLVERPSRLPLRRAVGAGLVSRRGGVGWVLVMEGVAEFPDPFAEVSGHLR